MDWKKTFNRGQWFLHTIFLLAVATAGVTTLQALKLNHLQQNQEERTEKINNLISELSKTQTFERIGRFLTRAEADKANDRLRTLQVKVAETEELLEMKVSKELSESIKEFNELIHKASGIASPTDALKLLDQKIGQVVNLAKEKNYRNVGIISSRMHDRLKQLNSNNVGSSALVGTLITDYARMKQIVTNSSLTVDEKEHLMNRFNGMSAEMGILETLNTYSSDLKKYVTKGSIALTQWVLDAETRKDDMQGLINRKQNQLLVSLSSVVSLLVLSWIAFAYISRKQKNKIGDQVELEVKSVIEKGILADQRFMMDHYSDSTRNDIVKLLDELKVRLNLGTMLHEGLPFSGCLVDNNFKLTWFNNLFLEQFYLSEEEVRSDAFNWDYLRDFLNLEEDPVYEALAHKIAGIYPVKLKQDEYTPMQPYEMYVTPITVNREDRVMVFFYPLISVKDAIDEQVNLARQCLKKFAQAWSDGELGEIELKVIGKDFQNNDLEELYDILKDLYLKLERERKECLYTINALEKENNFLMTTIDELKTIEAERKEKLKKEFSLVSELRNSFLQSVERSESLMQINKSILVSNDELKNEALKMQSVVTREAKRAKESMDILSNVETIRMDYKKLKTELMEVKSKLISLNSSLLAGLPVLDDQQQRLVHRYKEELGKLDYNVVTLDKKLSQLDVFLAKFGMINEKGHVEQTNFNLQTSQKDHELTNALNEIQKAVAQEENQIVEHFKNLHMLMKETIETSHR
ncbi:MAG: hypothetical protein WDA09_10895, partial [Bacteriovoracaceae bacterium]